MSSSVEASVLKKFGLPLSKAYGMTQADYIYDLHWSADVDKIFIDVLIDQHALGNFNPSLDNKVAIETALDVIKMELKLAFPYTYCARRVEVLRKRYNVFTWIAGTVGVHYDRDANMVFATPRLWAGLVKEDEFALAYMEAGDPAWTDFEKLFNPNQSLVPVIHVHEDEIPDSVYIDMGENSDDPIIHMDLKGKSPICKSPFINKPSVPMFNHKPLWKQSDLCSIHSSTASNNINCNHKFPTTGLLTSRTVYKVQGENRPPIRRFYLRGPLASASAAGSVSPHNL